MITIIVIQTVIIVYFIYLAFSQASECKHKIEVLAKDIDDKSVEINIVKSENENLKHEKVLLDNQLNNAIEKINKGIKL